MQNILSNTEVYAADRVKTMAAIYLIHKGPLMSILTQAWWYIKQTKLFPTSTADFRPNETEMDICSCTSLKLNGPGGLLTVH